MARLFYEFEDQMERYRERNEDGPRGALGQMAGFVRQRAQAAAMFTAEALPVLQWAQIKDQFRYSGSEALAAKAMLDHINANIAHDNAEGWLNELEGFVSGSGAPPTE